MKNVLTYDHFLLLQRWLKPVTMIVLIVLNE